MGGLTTVRRAHPFFSSDGFQDPVLEQRLGEHLFFQLAVLAFEFLEPACFAQLHPPELALPAMETHLRDVVLPTHLQDVLAPVGVPEDADFIFGRVTLAFRMVWVLSCSQTNRSTGPEKRSHVTPTDLQLSLFSGWHSKNPDYSRTLDFFDALPKFSLTHTRAFKRASILRFDDVQISGHRVAVSIAPAIIAARGSKQSKNLASEEDAKLIFPGVREELVEMAIRKLAVQQTVSTGLHIGRQTGAHIIRVMFTLSQLRHELTSAGHSLMLSQIREALEVLSRAILTVEAEHGAAAGALDHHPDEPALPASVPAGHGGREGISGQTNTV